jgi:hypothetical protein
VAFNLIEGVEKTFLIKRETRLTYVSVLQVPSESQIIGSLHPSLYFAVVYVSYTSSKSKRFKSNLRGGGKIQNPCPRVMWAPERITLRVWICLTFGWNTSHNFDP